MLTTEKIVSIEFNEEKLKERNRELYHLIEMSNFLAESMSLQSLLEGALRKVLECFDVEAGRIYLMDETGQCLNLAACHGMDVKGVEKVSLNEGFSGKAARTNSFIAQYVSHFEDKKRAEILSARGFKVIICVPLIVMGEVVGVMNLATGRIIKLDQEKIDFLTALGNLIAIAAINARLHEELKKKIEIVIEREAMIKFFAYSVSHDLKSPATGIYALAKRLQDKQYELLDEKGKACCSQIMKTAEQIGVLVDDTNTYIATKEASLNLRMVKTKEVIKATREEFSSRLKHRKIKWTVSDVMPEIIVDELTLLRVFRNLVENALKYGGEDLYEIKIGYEEDDLFHIFSFSDDGVGIKMEDREKIFDIFKRHETSRGTSGAGLGLAIVREIATRHQGKAWIDPGDGKGVTVCVSISKDLKPNDD